jgi:hypothetical protein
MTTPDYDGSVMPLKAGCQADSGELTTWCLRN